MKKTFRFTLKTKPSDKYPEGKLIAQRVVEFGTEKYPWPKDWEESVMAQMTLIEYKEKFIKEHIDVIIDEETELDL